MHADPIRQFQIWFDEALAAGATFPETFYLSLATAEGRPSVRAVLLRGVDDAGFRFFTNYRSRKGRELTLNPRAAGLFHWHKPDEMLGRQVIVEGSVLQVSREESDAYFASRPRGHQLGAWASEQSEPLDSLQSLVEREKAVAARFEGQDVPRPAWWGGFIIAPERMEFWEGKPNRLHERYVYERIAAGWTIGLRYP